MPDTNIVLPSKPQIILEEENSGVYEIDGLYPGYGHTLGNSLRRIILSSLPGAAITSVKINGVSHEFSTMEGVREDVLTIILNLKKLRFEVLSDEPQKVTCNITGPKEITAGDLSAPGQVRILNPEAPVASVEKGGKLEMEMSVEKGLGYVSKENLQKERVEIGTIALDASFTPIRRVNYEVENMRVGNRTDFNRIKIFIETDGAITPRRALESAIETMINQLKAIIGFKEEEKPIEQDASGKTQETSSKKETKELDPEFLKTRIESLGFSTRTVNALTNANIRTLGGLARKKEEDLSEIDGLGMKGVQEVRKTLSALGINLR